MRHLSGLLVVAWVVVCAWTGPAAAEDIGPQDVVQDVPACLPQCAVDSCGDDGCGGTCGPCPQGQVCVADVCTTPCAPQCVGAECGDDGCGGSCGSCVGIQECVQGACVTPCFPECTGLECGDDGCGGECGPCPPSKHCVAGMCQQDCAPECGEKFCGDDGCGGSCGTCADGEACWSGVCGPETPICGDGFCHVLPGENCENCAADCDCATNFLCMAGGQCVLDPLYDPGCTPHDTAGCDVCGCEACVCALDPYCCNTKWDARCVEECTLCGTGCVPPGECGNGVCEPAYGEHCGGCKEDCACKEGDKCANGVCVPDEGDSEGCKTHTYPGCSDCDCEDCVCAMDYYCCNSQWDSVCVSECKQCGTTCGGGTQPGQCGNWWCQPDQGENCGNCPNDCYCNWFEVCQDNACVVSGTNEGCWETYDAGCDNCACEECVCGIQPSCCEPGGDYYGGWDWNCVNMCQTQCGGCGPPVVCGDGTCVTQENCASCPEDCECKAGDVCFQDACCKPQCNGKQCGPDGCGGICGTCSTGVCDDGVCAKGLGCDTHQGPGCLNCQCQACVCELSPLCCSGDWTAGCASYCALDCGGCEKIPTCGDKICAPSLGENCSSCEADCGCNGSEHCFDGECRVDYCELGLSEAGCCDGNVLNLCVSGDLKKVDCADQQWICGWYAGSEDLASRYYCGPASQVDPKGDPSGTFPILCPECNPECNGNECGTDGCGGSCGSCGAGTVCKAGKCSPCTPDCSGLNCGHDGCGGSCGLCAANQRCEDGECVVVCTPQCTGKNCGPDGCGGSCGDCIGTLTCHNGKCTVCVSDCEGKLCGDDGCGGSCGICPIGWVCKNGACTQDTCTPSCTGKECGDDGCGGTCGVCPQGKTCDQNKCMLLCQPNCIDKECGSNGCGGTCGTCAESQVCTAGKCTAPCLPSCLGRECGDDGCGGRCGECAQGRFCNASGLCQSYDPDVVDASTSDVAADATPGKDTGNDNLTLRGGGCSAANASTSVVPMLVVALALLWWLSRKRASR